MAHIYIGNKYKLSVTDQRIFLQCEGEEIASFIPSTSVQTVTENENNFSENEDLLEELLTFEHPNDSTFVWTGKSSLWDKTYTLTCYPDGFDYSVTVKGTGAIGKVNYFADGSSITNDRNLRRANERHSTYEFYEYYTPNISPHPRYPNRRPSGLSFESSFNLLIPPPFLYAFRTWDTETHLGLGLIAEEGQYNFTNFDYSTVKRGEQFFFSVSTNLEGHTKVNGEFTLPTIRAFFGYNNEDILKQYCDYHYTTGLCRKKIRGNIPRWWYGPMVCGWHEQYTMMKDNIPQKEYATQKVYEHIADQIEKHNIHPTILIIDDKWQKTYGNCLPDTKKWHDMRGFIDKMHEKGIHTLLWFRLWGGEGLPDNEVIPLPQHLDPWEEGIYADPTSDAYQKHLKEILYKLLSPDEGCMNADGLKLDYGLVMPLGKAAKSRGGIYGTELTKALYTLIYNTAKEIKPDCLINASPAHPYFDEVCDMARLHDCSWEIRDQSARMTERANIFRTALPGVLIDTDSVNYASRPDAMRYFRTQPKIGIPDIYQFSDSCHITFTKEDWEEIEQIFNDYSSRIDRMFAEKEN